ncbi:endoplasmic reticulum protein ERp29, carboxy-terminal domain protein [Medicago truncatula]|uniref:Endoplasmic reticulum protein ERp29, carboxy-terminal domain protein n=1 Tax=Medicago truncatula TaxID=3880 RepID=G7IIY4_MEDTR|nr:endoplasmic reticulum protein ERp29, carboxy-terminal domain protein [Medicago truncatula]
MSYLAIKKVSKICSAATNVNDSKESLTDPILLCFTFKKHMIYFLMYMAGIVEDLDELVKEFGAANDEEKKAMFARIEEQVEKVKGSASRLNYTFGPRVLAYSRNWSCPFKTEQNGPSIIIFVAFFVLPPIFKL